MSSKISSGSSYISFDNDTFLDKVGAGIIQIGSQAATDVRIGGGYADLYEITAPANPPSNSGRIYVADDGGTTKLYFKDSSGNTTDLISLNSSGGSDGNIQYNNSGGFGGDSELNWNDTSKQLILGANSKLCTGGETSPDVDSGGVCINTGANDGKVVTLKNSDVSHNMTSIAEADTYAYISKSSSTAGGVGITGLSEVSVSINVSGHATTPGTGLTNSDYGIINISGYKSTGTGTSGLVASSENLFSIRNDSALLAMMKGVGDFHLVTGGIRVSDWGGGTVAGAIQWDGSNFQGYDGASWVNLDEQATTPSGSDSYIQYNNGGSFGGDSSFVWDDTNKRLGIGCSDPEYAIEISADAAESQIVSASFGTSSFPRIFVQRSRGTRASRSAVQSGDSLGQFAFRGQFGTGTNWFYGSYIESFATENWNASNRGADLRFQTTTTGSTSRTERFRISDSGKLYSFNMYSGYTIGGTNKDVYIDSTGLIGVLSSSERFKQNIIDMEDTSWIYNLRTVNFNYKKEPDIKCWGLIAEEVLDICPELVTHDSEGLPDGVTYSKLIPILLNEIKNLKSKKAAISSEGTSSFIAFNSSLMVVIAGISIGVARISSNSSLPFRIISTYPSIPLV